MRKCLQVEHEICDVKIKSLEAKVTAYEETLNGILSHCCECEWSCSDTETAAKEVLDRFKGEKKSIRTTPPLIDCKFCKTSHYGFCNEP